jgi:hypothetical protein
MFGRFLHFTSRSGTLQSKNTNAELELRHGARRLAGVNAGRCCHFISLFTRRRCAAAAASLKGRLLRALQSVSR